MQPKLFRAVDATISLRVRKKLRIFSSNPANA